MKKSHMILLVITAVMALFSAYSLAAINQVYKIDFEWYSQYNNRYAAEPRDNSGDRWQLADYPAYMQLNIVGEASDLDQPGDEHIVNADDIPELDLSKYMYIYCSLGMLASPEYGIKVEDIAQRANVVEVKISMNSPAKQIYKSTAPAFAFRPVDVIRIEKAAFPTKGRLYFIFKSQDGRQLMERYYDLK